MRMVCLDGLVKECVMPEPAFAQFRFNVASVESSAMLEQNLKRRYAAGFHGAIERGGVCNRTLLQQPLRHFGVAISASCFQGSFAAFRPSFNQSLSFWQKSLHRQKR